MNLIYLGTPIDAENEHELRNEFEHGVDAIIIYKNGRVETRNNCTEIHNRFESALNATMGYSIAFESDIHGTGGTVSIQFIETVVIVKSAEKSKNY